MTDHSKLLVAVCTRQRPVMLEQCIKSILNATKPENTDVSILVVENDSRNHSEAVITPLKESSPYALHYTREPRQGIPFARNCAVDFSIQEKMDVLVFIDDDEWVEKDWMVSMVSYRQTLNSTDIIYGKVLHELPPSCPQWMHHFFGERHAPTGTLLDFCATNNVLIPVKTISDLNLRFDETHPLAGNDDSIFFREATEKGASIYACNETVVHETIPASRATIKWLSKRKYRLGLDKALYKGRHKNKYLLLVSTVLRIPFRLLISCLCVLIGHKNGALSFWLKTCSTLGLAGGLLGAQYNEYQTVHGN